MVCCFPDGKTVTAEGEFHGEIAHEMKRHRRVRLRLPVLSAGIRQNLGTAHRGGEKRHKPQRKGALNLKSRLKEVGGIV